MLLPSLKIWNTVHLQLHLLPPSCIPSDITIISLERDVVWVPLTLTSAKVLNILMVILLMKRTNMHLCTATPVIQNSFKQNLLQNNIVKFIPTLFSAFLLRFVAYYDEPLNARGNWHLHMFTPLKNNKKQNLSYKITLQKLRQVTGPRLDIDVGGSTIWLIQGTSDS